MKKVCVPDVGSGMALAALREIAVLKELHSDCFIRLIDGAHFIDSLCTVLSISSMSLVPVFPILSTGSKHFSETLAGSGSLPPCR